MIVGASWDGGFGTLQTRRSLSEVWVASMSVFCLDEDPCQARPVMREGARVVVNVCKIVNDGCSVAMRMEPFIYLKGISSAFQRCRKVNVPNGKC